MGLVAICPYPVEAPIGGRGDDKSKSPGNIKVRKMFNRVDGHRVQQEPARADKSKSNKIFAQSSFRQTCDNEIESL